MKYSLLALFIFLTSPLFGQGLTPSQLPAYLKGVPHMPYHSVPNVLKFPKDVYLGEGAGVALNKQGDIFVSSRTGPGGHMLMEFDPNGNYVRSIGDSCYCFLFPHMVQVDSEGNVWTVDDGSNMVVKWHYDGTDWRPVLYLGRRSEPFGSRRIAKIFQPIVQYAHRCGLWATRADLRRRWIHERSSARVRQVWQVHQGLGRKGHKSWTI